MRIQQPAVLQSRELYSVQERNYFWRIFIVNNRKLEGEESLINTKSTTTTNATIGGAENNCCLRREYYYKAESMNGRAGCVWTIGWAGRMRSREMEI